MINVKRTTPQEEANPYEGLGAADVIDRGLLDTDTHVIAGEIDSESIALAMRWMIYENTSPIQKTLTLYINSVGGDLFDGLGLIDLMRSSKHVIRTVGVGNVMSTAFLIFCSGTKPASKLTSSITLALLMVYYFPILGTHVTSTVTGTT